MTPTRISHVGIAVQSIDALIPFYRDVLSLPDTPLDDSDGARISGFTAGGDSLVELSSNLRDAGSQPIGEVHFDKRGPGIHHICFTVDDLDADAGRVAVRRVSRSLTTTPRTGAEGRRVAFLHPKSTGGVLISELSE